MDKHLPTHEWSTDERRPCSALEYRWRDFESNYGHDRCNEYAETVANGLRYSTKTADLVAVNDGRDFGVYLFRTPRGQYFEVAINYPMRGDRTRPLRLLSIDEALTLYGEIARRPWAAVAPMGEAFPGVTVGEG